MPNASFAQLHADVSSVANTLLSAPLKVYEARLAALLAARNDRKDEHKRALERYKKVRKEPPVAAGAGARFYVCVKCS